MERIVVVGAGTMGAGIASLAAAAGYAVTLVEPNAAGRERAAGLAQRDITLLESLPERYDAELAIEAVPEQLDLKRAVFAQLARTLGERTLLATNTSSLSVAQIAAHVAHPERVLGLHFFNPPAAMKLVEIIAGEQTSQDAILRAHAFVERLGKTAVDAADTPGFIVNRIARPYYLQAMRAYELGVAPIEDLDRLARGVGFRMGPFELMDFIGLDVNLSTSESVYERTEAERLRPEPLQRDLVAAKRFGRKSGTGFYDYAGGPPVHADIVEPSAEKNADEAIAVVGFSATAVDLAQLLAERYAHVQTIGNDDLLDDISPDATIVVDCGDAMSDRTEIAARLDRALPPECILFVDAYASDVGTLTSKVAHPARVVGYGMLASPLQQRAIEIIDGDATSDDALEVAQDLFASIGRHAVLVSGVPGLFLGRTIGAIINEAMYVVDERIASPQDVDLAMRLGANYPRGPLEWGKQIGGARLSRILRRVAAAEGAQYAPHRALWVLDAEDVTDLDTSAETFGAFADA